MKQTGKKERKHNRGIISRLQPCGGFTLIELLLVVTIIGIIAAIAIPGFIGVQERAKKGAVIRSASSAESEIQAWLASANKGLVGGIGVQGQLFEVDSDGNGAVTAADMNNYNLGLSLAAGTLCSNYIIAKQRLQPEMCPWGALAGSLWQDGAPAPGRITCQVNSGLGATSIIVTAQDPNAMTIHLKELYAD